MADTPEDTKTEAVAPDVTPVEPAAPVEQAAPGDVAATPATPETGSTESEEIFESQLDSIKIKVEAFEGPLDLLVHLIKKNKMNVYDIQISVITKQYLEYLDLMQELNLDIASEFLVMSATLIHIKSKLLLPRPETATGDPVEEEDPRDALVRRLLEHQKFKAAAELLHDRETLRNAQWARPDSRIEEIAGDDYEPEIEVDLFSLLSAFKQVLERAREAPFVPLPPEELSIETRIEQLLERLSETEACGFEDLFEGAYTRSDMIVTFLAMLEMIRLKLIRVFQQGGQGAIRVYKRSRPTDAPHPIHDPEDEFKAHHPQQDSGTVEQGSGDVKSEEEQK
ncbi:MAG: Segregation and condensation protein [Acidobacteriota bacterium]